MLVNVGTTEMIPWRLRDEEGAPFDAASVVATLKDPTGAITTPMVTHTGTGDYLVGAPIVLVGDWFLTWTSTGPAEVEVVAISALPSASAAPWAPDLRRVGQHIPSRTREVAEAGAYTNDPVGTFTDDTYPTGEIVTGIIGSAVAVVAGTVGMPVAAAAYPLCQAAAALWSAYWVELGYPERDADVSVYGRLRDDAVMLTAQAKDVNIGAGGGTIDPPDEDGVVPELSSFCFPPARPCLIL